MDGLLDTFDLIRLDELEQLDFSSRYDFKFLLRENQLPHLLRCLSTDYLLLKIGQKYFFHYETLYFDTSDYLCYYRHHNGWAVRHKLRFRSYADSGTVVFEIKSKDNKGRGIKKRFSVQQESLFVPYHLQETINSTTGLHAKSLLPSLRIGLDRITLVHRHRPEKITFDLNLRMQLQTQAISFNRLVIAEVKQKKRSTHSDFFRLCRQTGIYPASISKYCLGIALLHPHVKYNRFKPLIRRLKKITL
ncbi:MAG: VTC domain-containing protein [Chitinophagales bacterium]|nr:MAG: VTC domain-containing protein [Chitinophagales bacterium]